MEVWDEGEVALYGMVWYGMVLFFCFFVFSFFFSFLCIRLMGLVGDVAMRGREREGEEEREAREQAESRHVYFFHQSSIFTSAYRWSQPQMTTSTCIVSTTEQHSRHLPLSPRDFVFPFPQPPIHTSH